MTAAVPPIVTTVEALTPDWVTQVLHHGAQPVEWDQEPTVVAARASPIGTGQIGDSIRVELTYAEPVAGAPETLVVKLPASDETSRAAGVATGNYEKEVWWYQQLADTVAVRTPRCWFAGAVAGTANAVVVLEDLAPAVQGDQIVGATGDQATLAMTQIARLHGPRWDDPRLHEVTWLGRRDPESAANVQGLYDLLLPGWVDRYGQRVGSETLEVVSALGPRLSEWMASYEGPLGLTHGDYRLDNLLFTDHDAAVVDWGGVGHGPPLVDVAYFCGAGLLPDDRAAQERDLLAAYRSELDAQGIAVDQDWLWREYRRQTFAGLVVTVVASMIVRQDERGDDMFVAMATRHARHVLDLDGFGAI